MARGKARRLNRREFLKTTAAGAVTVGAVGTMGVRLGAAEAARKPNLVFLFADQHRNCSWPGGGDPQVKTPNLEAMARQGAVLTHCFSNHPLCSPYRASLLTGRYQQAHTVSQNVKARGGLPVTEVTIADVLKKAGYATGYVGKWHLYPGSLEGTPVPPGPHRHGFDWWRACFNYRSRYQTKYYDDAGKVVLLPDYAPKCQMDLVLEFIEKHAAEPFCILLSWHPPHGPYTEAPKRFVEMYPPEKVQIRPNVPKASDRMTRVNHQGYFSHVTALDEEVGRAMKKLDELGLAQNTILCYSSDHGDMLGSYNRYGKNVPWEESVNVPFVIRWPAGIPAGRRVDALFASVDITPTLLGLIGLPLLPQMQGADLSAILKGGNDAGPESVFLMGGGGGGSSAEESETQGVAAEDATSKGKGKGKDKTKGTKGGWRGVRTRRYTYAKMGDKPWLLYDNEKDPCQLKNLAEDPAHEATRKELETVLVGWLKGVGEA